MLRGRYLRTFGALFTKKNNGILSNCTIMNERSEYDSKNEMIDRRIVEALARALSRLEKLLLTCLMWIMLYPKRS